MVMPSRTRGSSQISRQDAKEVESTAPPFAPWRLGVSLFFFRHHAARRARLLHQLEDRPRRPLAGARLGHALA